jgi:hypothetical protein
VAPACLAALAQHLAAIGALVPMPHLSCLRCAHASVMAQRPRRARCDAKERQQQKPAFGLLVPGYWRIALSGPFRFQVACGASGTCCASRLIWQVRTTVRARSFIVS